MFADDQEVKQGFSIKNPKLDFEIANPVRIMMYTKEKLPEHPVGAVLPVQTVRRKASVFQEKFKPYPTDALPEYATVEIPKYYPPYLAGFGATPQMKPQGTELRREVPTAPPVNPSLKEEYRKLLKIGDRIREIHNGYVSIAQKMESPVFRSADQGKSYRLLIEQLNGWLTQLKDIRATAVTSSDDQLVARILGLKEQIRVYGLGLGREMSYEFSQLQPRR